LPFLVIAVLLFAASRARERSLSVEAVRAAEPIQRAPDGGESTFLPIVVPWALALSPDLGRLDAALPTSGVRPALAGLREALFERLGVLLPPGRLRVDLALPPRSVALELHELPAERITFPPDLPDAELAALARSELLPALAARAPDFLGISETQDLLDRLEQVAPAVARQVVPKPIALPVLADVLRRLVEERVSIRDLRAVLEALAQVGGVEKDTLNLTEFVRSQLRRPITHALTGGARELGVVLLDSPIEGTLRGAVQRTPAGSFLALAPAAARDVTAAVRRTLSTVPADRPFALLTQPDIRRFVRKLVELDFPDLRVVSYAELLPEVMVRPLAKVTV
jgi:type III secretion protein V